MKDKDIKFCSGCGEWKSRSEFNLRGDKGLKPNQERHRSRCKDCCYKQHRANIVKNPKTAKEGNWRAKGINITLEEYEALFELQNGKCRICDKEEVGRLLPVDHNHETGVVRGLLCTSCNTKLGWFETYYDQIKDYLGGGLDALGHQEI